MISFLYHKDGTTAGDGTEIGKCPSSYSNVKCLSTGECKVCKIISGIHQGCSGSTPICVESTTNSCGKASYKDTTLLGGSCYYRIKNELQIKYFVFSDSWLFS